MYYEEKLIDGTLWCRTTPNGQWRRVETKRAAVIAAIAELTDDERVGLASLFCCHCGRLDPACQCWNDD